MSTFQLDPRLASDSVCVTQLELCQIRLMNDSRYPWLVLVPCRAGLVELDDLPDREGHLLWTEIGQAAQALRGLGRCDKLNVGALGNIVRQLHVHVIARREGDAAWPGPVWDVGTAQRYPSEVIAGHVDQLRRALAA